MGLEGGGLEGNGAPGKLLAYTIKEFLQMKQIYTKL